MLLRARTWSRKEERWRSKFKIASRRSTTRVKDLPNFLVRAQCWLGTLTYTHHLHVYRQPPRRFQNRNRYPRGRKQTAQPSSVNRGDVRIFRAYEPVVHCFRDSRTLAVSNSNGDPRPRTTALHVRRDLPSTTITPLTTPALRSFVLGTNFKKLTSFARIPSLLCETSSASPLRH